MADRPSAVSKSRMTALMRSLEPESSFAASSADLLAKASLSVPHKPLGSAADTTMPATIVPSKTLAHSSGVKFCLFAMVLSSPFTEACIPLIVPPRGSDRAAADGVSEHDNRASSLSHVPLPVRERSKESDLLTQRTDLDSR